jgi:hypothetical protein
MLVALACLSTLYSANCELNATHRLCTGLLPSLQGPLTYTFRRRRPRNLLRRFLFCHSRWHHVRHYRTLPSANVGWLGCAGPWHRPACYRRCKQLARFIDHLRRHRMHRHRPTHNHSDVPYLGTLYDTTMQYSSHRSSCAQYPLSEMPPPWRCTLSSIASLRSNFRLCSALDHDDSSSTRSGASPFLVPSSKTRCKRGSHRTC